MDTIQILPTGARVRALYPNEGIVGHILAVRTDPSLKPYVVFTDEGRVVYFHRDQVEAV